MAKKPFFNPWASDAPEKPVSKAPPGPARPEYLEDPKEPEHRGVHIQVPPYGGFLATMDTSAGEALARLARAAATDAAVVKALAEYAVDLTVGAQRPTEGFFVYDAGTRTCLSVRGVHDRSSALLQIVQGLLALARDPYLSRHLQAAGITPYRK